VEINMSIQLRRKQSWRSRILGLAVMAVLGAAQARAMDDLPLAQAGEQIGGRLMEERAEKSKGGEARLSELAIGALHDDKTVAARAIAELRAAGPAGLAAMMSTHRAAIDRHVANPLGTEPMWERLSAALDTIAAQKDAWSAGLYWYTDLEAAKKAASAQNKPIISLRLLGTLDTDFSCANSRFFRTVLYPNAQVGKFLREGYVLHWQSHRPVPRLTIDYGDGRIVERTITGNSVHYVLTPEGRVVDVIPGLYGPAAFMRELQNSLGLASHYKSPRFESDLTRYHQVRAEETRRAWAADLKKLGVDLPVATTVTLSPGALDGKAMVERANRVVLNQNGEPQIPAPPAIAAARIAMSKGRVELAPILAMIPERAALAAKTNEDLWPKIAALHAADATLDAGSRRVMLSKMGPSAAEANSRTRSKAFVETPLMKMVRSFERSVAEDTVHNEYLLHSQIHDWFAKGALPTSLDDLNERVYAELFLMPKTDAWLGLMPEDAYTALPASATGRR